MKTFLPLLFALLISGASIGQDLMTLDSLPQSFFFAGVSPVILNEDQVEVNFVNTLTSFWLAINEFDLTSGANYVGNRTRFTRFDQLLRVSYGFAENKRWDLGAEFRYAHVRNDDEAQSSPFRVFENDRATGISYRALSMVGARLRAMPFRQLPALTAQAAINFPVAKDVQTRRSLGADRTQTDVTLTYYEPFNPKTYYFLQGQWLTLFSNDENSRTTHVLNGGAFLVQNLWRDRLHAFPGISYVTTVQNGSRINQQLYGSFGAQYQVGYKASIFLNGQIPFIFDSGSQFVEWVRESYSSVTLGIRVLP